MALLELSDLALAAISAVLFAGLFIAAWFLK